MIRVEQLLGSNFEESNLTAASSNWTVLGMATKTSSGQYQFSDPQVTSNQQQRFYRVRWP